MVKQLNTFRRIRAVDLNAADMQKIYWDENLELLAHQTISSFDFLRMKKERSMIFWMQTLEKRQMKRAKDFLFSLTKMDSHGEDRATASVWNRAFNLAINAGTIRIGCAEGEVHMNSSKSIVMLCAFGPNQLFLNDNLYKRGPICSSCPFRTGCEDNLCDEKVAQGLPPITDILGVRMSKKSQITVLIAIIVGIFIVFCSIMVQYYA